MEMQRNAEEKSLNLKQKEMRDKETVNFPGQIGKITETNEVEKNEMDFADEVASLKSN